jgi:hypothetical protein
METVIDLDTATTCREVRVASNDPTTVLLEIVGPWCSTRPWTTLTPGEARRVASALLEGAEAAERRPQQPAASLGVGALSTHWK